jgi:hypothetical protein
MLLPVSLAPFCIYFFCHDVYPSPILRLGEGWVRADMAVKPMFVARIYPQKKSILVTNIGSPTTSTRQINSNILATNIGLTAISAEKIHTNMTTSWLRT